MITTETPIGEIINFLYKSDNLNRDEYLFKKVRNLVDLIVLRVKEYGLKETLHFLEDDLFKLRIELINESEILQDITKNLNKNIQNRIKLQFDNKTNQETLELAFVTSIKIYGEIAENIIEKSSENTFTSIKHLSKLDYKDFIDLLKSLPGKESQFIISFIKSSIALDFAIIVSELIFGNKLKLRKSEIENLILILKNSIEEYAIFSYQFGFWEPSAEDESKWIRNIKIRISLFESKSISNNYTSNDIKNMLVA